MRVNIQITGAQATRDKLAALAERMRNLHPAYMRAGVVVLRAAQQRINESGPGWPPAAYTPTNSKGKPIGHLLYRTGALYRSLADADMPGGPGEGNIAEEFPGGIRVGTNLRTPDGKYSIGILQQYGTGIYNARGMYPARKHTKSGKPAKMVRGIPPRKFLFISPNVAEKVAQVFASRVKGEE